MRGRLINPFLATIAQLDTAATALDPDIDGPLTGGYDRHFREPVTVRDDSERGRAVVRTEKPDVTFTVQIEPELIDQLQMMQSGQSPQQRLQLVAHFSSLEEAELIDENGEAVLRKGDRLVALSDLDGNLIMRVLTPPGLYLTDIRNMGWGIGRQRNLLYLGFEQRALSTPSAGG